MSEVEIIEDRYAKFEQGLIEVEEVCLHTPDMLRLVAQTQTSDTITQSFRCDCGKLVRDIYHLLRTEEIN